ncbi:helix-turn-helix transcriptional regulator [Actinomyces sp. MRS3W]|uniref:helix-turn-helix transcriptional regulator n=1 Tax=Actinomyces sp. MRS3W TaxID=2800796 RepID=UPI0028FD4704|nr:WYL domain-containing protein [Actinomyces sp. MRS3W]MDU0348031.1 WYL domain-containing protein [Actinomyces sp. MRS3W]
MRADRLLRMIWILSGRARPTPSPELAERLGVSVRTVLRDVEALSAAGVPVYTQQGRGGGVSLLPHWRPDMLGLDDDEARALTAVVSVAGAKALGVDDSVRRALAKVGASAGGASSGNAVQLASRVVIDPDGWLPGVGASPWLKEALMAVERHESVRFRYTAGASGKVRSVDTPALGLLCAGSDWYLVGRARQDTRFYRLDRIDDLARYEAAGAQKGSRTNADAAFDLLAEWQEARSRFRVGFHPLPAVLEVDADAVGRLRSLVRVEAVDGQAAMDSAHEGHDGEGASSSRVRAEVTFADISHALEALPRLAGRVRVVEPRELRAGLRRLAEQLLADCEEAHIE